MAKKKLLTDILANPTRFYRVPGDVLRDRRFGDGERRQILTAWLATDNDRVADVAAGLSELEGRNINHAAE